MPVITSEEIEKCLRGILFARGYSLSSERSIGENGADIIASKDNELIYKDNELIYIEVISFKAKGPSRAKDFFEVFFRVISRLDNGAKKCVIALPQRAAIGLTQRVLRYKVGWERIGKVFPELEIWFIDKQNNKCICTSWNHWLFYVYGDLSRQHYWEL